VRALVAAVAFPATWIVVAAGLVDGFARILAVVVAQAVALPVALWLVEHDVAAVRALLARHRAAQATARVPALAHRRAALVAAVAAAGTPTQR
jgi:hypothetical protein